MTEELENAITPEMRELQNAYMAYVVALAEGTRLVGTAHGCLRDAIKNAPAAAVPQPVTLELALTDQAHTDAAAMLEGRPASPLDANWQRSLALRQHHVTSRSA